MKDFSLEMLRELLSAVKSNQYTVLRFNEYWDDKTRFDNSEKILLLRHDVDRFPETALETARMENEIGVYGTYFFRVKPWTYKPEIIKEISSLGHEIGYHYENLADTDGDFKKAADDCRRNLEKLREITEINSAAMHSRPLSKWDNRLLWDKFPLNEFNLKGETYRSIDHFRYTYIADSGRDWNADRTVVWDSVNGSQPPLMKNGTLGLIDAIKAGKFNSIQLLIHPNRWPKNYPAWVWQSLMDGGINAVKKIILLTKKKKAK